MSHGRPIKVTDSERSSSTNLANAIQNMLLDKTVKLLDKNQKTVVHRICLNQKLVLRRHQQKVHESQMNHARIMGDKELETQLRRKCRGRSACMDDIKEADETLMKLWRQGEQDFRALKRRLGDKDEMGPPLSTRPKSAFVDLSNKARDDDHGTDHLESPSVGRPTTSMSLVRTLKRSTTSMSVNLPARRSVTGIAMNNAHHNRSSTSLSMASPNRTKSGNVMVLQTNPQNYVKRSTPAAVGLNESLLSKRTNQVRPETPDVNSTITIMQLNNCDLSSNVNRASQKLNGYSRKVSTSQATPRPKTSIGHSTVNSMLKTSKSQGQNLGQGQNTRPNFMHRKSILPVFLENEQEKTALLERHRERVKSANYTSKINTFMDDLKEWRVAEKDVIQDYYYVGQIKSKRLNSEGTMSMKPTELKRYTGNLQIKNLTFPKLDM